jgi:hypothetical protein
MHKLLLAEQETPLPYNRQKQKKYIINYKSRVVQSPILFIIIAVGLFITPKIAHSAVPCSLLDSAKPVYKNYAASFNVHSPQHELLLTADCSSSQPKVTIGADNPSVLVYNKGYKTSGTSWTPLTLTCSGQSVSDNNGNTWCRGMGTATLTQSDVWFAAYTCQQIAGLWKCGCRDSACSTTATPPSGGLWQLQGIINQTGSGGENKHDFRIGYSADGNYNDADDWHASPLSLAMIAKAGMQGALVHFEYNNILGKNIPDWEAKHEEVVLGAAQRYGFNRANFYNAQKDLKGAVNSISRAINTSSADNKFYLICAGPMEVCWQGINAAQDDKEQFVTVISHSTWNDTANFTPQLKHTWTDIEKDFDVKTLHINDQNKTAFFSSPSAWSWLKDVTPNGQWLYEAITIDAKTRYGPPGDASDAGMVFYLITGNPNATMSDIKNFFNK